MKAIFEVSIIIDGYKVQTAMGPQKGFEGMNPEILVRFRQLF